MSLTRAFLPADADVETKAIKRPPLLRRDVATKKRRTVADEIAAFAMVLAQRRPRLAVIAHRDCDAVEPAHIQDANQLEIDLRAAGVRDPIVANPAWEIETWWMLFPDALSATRGCWKRVDYSNRDVGLIVNSKEDLRRKLRPLRHANKCPDYTESDSIKIAANVLQMRLADNAAQLKSDSLQQFRRRLLAVLMPTPPPASAPATV